MKKIFVPLSALAMLALVACGQGQSSSHATGLTSESSHATGLSSSTEEVVAQIANKEALQAEWHVGEADRAIEFNLSPKINITQAIADGIIVITSSNAEAVSVLGRQLHAAGEGDAKITITYKGQSDSVDLHVDAAIVEPDYAAPKTLSQIMELTSDELVTPESDANHTYSKLAYPSRVKVAVLGSKVDGSNPADKYGNLYVVDPSSNEAEPAKIQVYGSGSSFSALSYVFDGGYYKYVNAQNYLDNEDTKGIKVGDELDVIIIRADYKSTKEISMVIRAINDKPIANDVKTTDEVNATEDSKNVRAQLVSVSGTITAWASGKEDGTKYGNFYIKSDDAKGEAVYVYGATASSTKTITGDEGDTIVDVLAMQNDGSWKFNNPQDFLTNEETKDLTIGSKVTILGFRCDYKGTIELNGIVKKYIEPAEEPDPVDATIADLNAKTAPENDKLYNLSGIWEFGKGDDFGGGYLTDPATGDSILVYGATKTATAFSFDGKSGKPVFKFTNPKDAKTTLASLHDGDKVSVLAMNAYFARESLPEINCVITDIKADTTKYTASVETPENGTVELSKNADLAYGEEVTVTATPAEGYKLDSVKVIDAHGGETKLTGETLKFKATCVNKVVATFVDKAASQVKIEKTSEDYAKALEWTASAGSDIGTKFSSFALDEKITVSFTGSGNTATYWSADKTIRIYGTKETSDASVSFAAAEGYKILTVKLTFTTSNSPTFPLTSGVAADVNAASVKYDITSGAKNGQVKITAFEIVYDVAE